MVVAIDAKARLTPRQIEDTWLDLWNIEDVALELVTDVRSARLTAAEYPHIVRPEAEPAALIQFRRWVAELEQLVDGRAGDDAKQRHNRAQLIFAIDRLTRFEQARRIRKTYGPEILAPHSPRFDEMLADLWRARRARERFEQEHSHILMRREGAR